MADNFIPLDITKRLGNQLRTVIDTLRAALDGLEKHTETMTQQTDGTIWTTVEQEYGVPAGEGEAVYNLVSGAQAAVNVPAVQQLLSYMG
jgi:hypothetical protein